MSLQSSTEEVGDGLVQDWRCRQSGANPSPSEFPDKQGKYRGTSKFKAESGRRQVYNELIFRASLIEFPRNRNRESNSRNREFKPWNRDLFARPAKRPPWSPAGSNRGQDLNLRSVIDQMDLA